MTSRSKNSSLKNSTEIKDLKLGFKKVLNKFINDNERGIYSKVNNTNPLANSPPVRMSPPKLHRDAVGSKSFSGYGSSTVLTSPRGSSGLTSPRGSGCGGFSKAIALEAYQTAEISPRDILRLKRSGKSTKDFNQAVSLVSAKLNREYQNSESELLLDINRQLNDLRGNSSNVSSKVLIERKRRASI